MELKNSLFAGGSISLKKTNQDSYFTKECLNLNCNILVVADGIGSFHQSEIASKFVSNNVIDIIERLDDVQKLNLIDVFKEVQLSLKEKYEKEFKEEDRTEKAYGTTLICCVETVDEFIIGYVGNGAIFHIRGDFNTFPERFYLPWNSINLLNPHSKEEEGKNAMYRFIAPNCTSQQITPTIIRLSKDEYGSGDIIMLCTDGIYSYDEVKMGKDPNGEIWISGENSMELFYKHFKLFYQRKEFQSDSLKEMINNYLEDLKSNELIDDDATMAITISSVTFKDQKAIYAEDEKNN